MIEKISRLKSTITQEQMEGLRAILKDSFNSFESAMEASDEESAISAVENFTAELKRSPFKLLKLNRLLTREQRSMVIDLIPEDEDEDE